jgi:hypothetical protein
MGFADLAVWTPGRVLEGIVGFAILSLVLCGLTTVFIAGYSVPSPSTNKEGASRGIFAPRPEPA